MRRIVWQIPINARISGIALTYIDISRDVTHKSRTQNKAAEAPLALRGLGDVNVIIFHESCTGESPSQ
jgi:hypothetical protein